MGKHDIFYNADVRATHLKAQINYMDNNITDIVNEGKFDHCDCEGHFDQLMVGNLDHLLDVHFEKYVCYKINCG